ncbi:MAG: hemolysin family protein [Anaerovoracaceae bacterium]
MDSDSSGYILIMVALIAVMAYLSAVGSAFSSADGSKLKTMADSGDRKADRALKVIAGRDKLRVSILTMNTVLVIVVTAMSTALSMHLWGTLGAVLAAAATAVISILCCVAFGAVGEARAERLAKVSVTAIRAVETVLIPVSVPLVRMKRRIFRPLSEGSGTAVTEDEILTMLEEAENAGSIEEEHSELIQKAIGFYDLAVEDVMTPRPSICAVDSECSNDEVAEIFRKTGYSRLPVYEEDMDKIIGVINHKDFCNNVMGTTKNITDYIVPAIFVSTTMKISDLLQKMQKMKIHMAVVIDEYGGTEGLITVEDIVEELVGEIFDEHDAVISKDILPLQNGSFRVKCGTNINKLFEYFGIEEIPDVVTVNGWVVMNLDKMPEKNDTFETAADGKRMKVRVTKADGRKAVEINLKVEEA